MRRSGVVLCAALVVASCSRWAAAQNDWQFPDPYFGALEIEKSRPSGTSWRTARPTPEPSSRFRPFLRRFSARDEGPATRGTRSPVFRPSPGR